MAKNLMPEVAALLGVEIGEEFIIQNADRKETVVLAADGLHVTKDDFLGSSNSKLLQNVLCGLFGVKKLPWEPKALERFYYPFVYTKGIESTEWADLNTFHLTLKALGMVYRTREEAEAHFAEDYEKLTGKKLEG